MILEETKQLLRTHRIAPNKLLGQNFMVQPAFYSKMCTYASLNQSDVVLDAGAGFGFLARFLADKCRGVVAVEKDLQVAKVLCEQVNGLASVSVVVGDVLKADLPAFNKVLSIPPYYLSTRLVTWLVNGPIDCSVLIVQTEFANRLVAKVGSEDYSWLTVTVLQQAQAELFDVVSKEMFFPQPEVDSVIVRLKPWKNPPFKVTDAAFFGQMTKWLFTQRNKKLSNAIAPFLRTSLKLSKQDSEAQAKNIPFRDCRARELAPQQFGELANALCN
jgi:16S rRNA (adenine1518-N6/adenine1519-N6)-dimethyltransferase